MTATAAQFAAELLAVFKPDDNITPVEWMQENCKYLPGPIGSFHTTHSPWLVGPINAVFDPEVRSVINLAAIGSGKSVFIAVVTSYILAKNGGDFIVYQPTDDNSKGFMRETLRPIWEGCPPVAALMPSGREVNTKSQRIGTSLVLCLGADAENNLQRYHTKWVFIDEAWKVAENKGYITQAKSRTLSFGFLSKVVLTGQGGVSGDDYEAEWLNSTQEEYSWKCPHCATIQPWAWEQIKIPPEGLTAEGINEAAIMARTHMECRECKHSFADNDQVRHDLNLTSLALPNYGYVRTNFAGLERNRGFRWNCLPARSWGDAAVQYCRARLAQTNGDETPMQLFMQKHLGQFHKQELMETTDDIPPGPFKMKEDWPDEGGYDINERAVIQRYEAREGVCRLRFLGIDVQRDGFYCLVRAWSADGKSRLVDWAYFNTIEEVDAFRKAREVVAPFTFIDSGDQQDYVFRVAAKLGWNCTRGLKKTEYPWPQAMPDGTTRIRLRPYSKPREVEPFKGLVTRVYYFGNLPFKDLLWRLRRSGIHQHALDAGETYSKQMAAERRVKTAAGAPVWRGPKARANHLWDCETILMLPALVLGLAGEDKRTMGEAEVEPPTEEDQQTGPTSGVDADG